MVASLMQVALLYCLEDHLPFIPHELGINDDIPNR